MISSLPVIDHVFICTALGAPAALRLRQLGIEEGMSNRHPGQGTACRRFFFQNAMLELLWVEDGDEARSPQTSPTRLWERWSAAGRGASPLGIVLRPASEPERCPFPAWEYRPEGMPDLQLWIASDTAMAEPMWAFQERSRSRSMEQPAACREITGVRLVGPPLPEDSVTKAMARHKAIFLGNGPVHLLELEFDGVRSGVRADLRPDLPLVCRW